MPYSMKFYQDQLTAGSASSAPLPPAHRMLYLRHGEVTANGRRMTADDSGYLADALELRGEARWSELWRFEIAQPNADWTLFEDRVVTL